MLIKDFLENIPKKQYVVITHNYKPLFKGYKTRFSEFELLDREIFQVSARAVNELHISIK
ncbi:hypothetical protein [Lysinibacillus zambalensis]